MIAIGTLSDGTTLDLTRAVTWSSTNASAATISNSAGTKGQLTGTAPGNSTIGATLAGISGSVPVTITAAVLESIQIEPTNPSVAKGTTLQFAALGIYSDGTAYDLTTSALWDSSDTAVAQVSNAAGSQGLLFAVARGTATVSAVMPHTQISGSTTVTVTAATLTSISVEPIELSLAAGTSEQLTATGLFSDGTKLDLTGEADWTTTSSSIAVVGNTIGNHGLVTGVAVGNVTITATLLGKSGSSSVTVTSATLTSIEISPAAPRVAVGTSVELAAIGEFSDGSTEDLTQSATWASSAPNIVSVSNLANKQGIATGLNIGQSTVSANVEGIVGSTRVTVTPAVLVAIDVFPANLTIASGEQAQMIAIGVFSDATTLNITSSVLWSSSDSGSLTVSNLPGRNGQVKGVAPGVPTVTAELEGISGSETVTVTTATLSSIVVTPEDSSIEKGTNIQLTATGIYSDGTTQDLTDSVTWTSSNSAVADVSDESPTEGLVTGIGQGTATITAAMPQTSVSGSTSVTVTAATLTAIDVEPSTAEVPIASTVQLHAQGIFSDGTTIDLTSFAHWTTSAASIAVVSDTIGSQGEVTGCRKEPRPLRPRSKVSRIRVRSR